MCERGKKEERGRKRSGGKRGTSNRSLRTRKNISACRALQEAGAREKKWHRPARLREWNTGNSFTVLVAGYKRTWVPLPVYGWACAVYTRYRGRPEYFPTPLITEKALGRGTSTGWMLQRTFIISRGENCDTPSAPRDPRVPKILARTTSDFDLINPRSGSNSNGGRWRYHRTGKRKSRIVGFNWNLNI